jgi:hypothetical protein
MDIVELGIMLEDVDFLKMLAEAALRKKGYFDELVKENAAMHRKEANPTKKKNHQKAYESCVFLAAAFSQVNKGAENIILVKRGAKP